MGILRLFPEFLSQLLAYREYLIQSVVRDLQKKYKRSTLGYLWTMLHPLGMMSVLTVVFSKIMQVPTKDYAVFLFCGILSYNFFSTTVMMSLSSMRVNARLYSQIAVPKFLFVLSIALSNLFNFVVSLIPLGLIALCCGHSIAPTWIMFPVIIIPLILVTVGLSLILAASNVFFEDTLHLVGVALQAIYFLSPVLYQRDRLPDWLVDLLVLLNPLFCQIEFIRSILYQGVLPEAPIFLVNLAGSALLFLIGLWIFRRSEDKFLYFV